MHLNANVGNKCGRVKEKAVWQRLFVLVKKKKEKLPFLRLLKNVALNIHI